MTVISQLIDGNTTISLNNQFYGFMNMSEAPDVQVSQSDTYKEINVTGQVSNLNYDGMKLTVLHDSFNLQPALSGAQFKMSKATINRTIECTINLSPVNLKSWAILFDQELKKYEKLFGTILSPEEINEKFKNPPK